MRLVRRGKINVKVTSVSIRSSSWHNAKGVTVSYNYSCCYMSSLSQSTDASEFSFDQKYTHIARNTVNVCMIMEEGRDADYAYALCMGRGCIDRRIRKQTHKSRQTIRLSVKQTLYHIHYTHSNVKKSPHVTRMRTRVR